MRQIKTIKHEKIWGYEIWLHSPLKGLETSFQDNGEKNTRGPLVKIIKANKPLSVQVHPDDILAKELENQNNGKSESWYILDNDPDAELVAGLKSFDENIIRQKISDNTFEELLIKVKVNTGDFFNIPSGLIHGIGSGITVLEVQQPSDTTYRYYDYNRLQDGLPRELHIDKAIKCQKDLPYELKPISSDPIIYRNSVGTQTYTSGVSTLNEQSIIVDLNTYNAYVGEIGEKINLENYSIISF